MRLPPYVLLAALLAPAFGAEPAPDSLLEDARDQMVERAYVPTADNIHGEARLLRRGQAVCMESVLHSPQLRRGLREIAAREAMHWPAGQTGHADSTNYLAALESARTEVLSPPGSSLPDTLVIDYLLARDRALFVLYDAEIECTATGWSVTDRRLLDCREVSLAYASRDIRLMAKAAFRLTDAELKQRLTDAGWFPVDSAWEELDEAVPVRAAPTP